MIETREDLRNRLSRIIEANRDRVEYFDGERTPNLPALRKLDEWIIDQSKKRGVEREWMQREWRCGTGMCCAGYVTEAMSDYDWLENDPNADWSHVAIKRDANGDFDYGTTSTASAVAIEVLGLSYEQASSLFAGSRTAPEIHRIISNIFEAEGDRL